jgi:hypothetical protein
MTQQGPATVAEGGPCMDKAAGAGSEMVIVVVLF